MSCLDGDMDGAASCSENGMANQGGQTCRFASDGSAAAGTGKGQAVTQGNPTGGRTAVQGSDGASGGHRIETS